MDEIEWDSSEAGSMTEEIEWDSSKAWSLTEGIKWESVFVCVLGLEVEIRSLPSLRFIK